MLENTTLAIIVVLGTLSFFSAVCTLMMRSKNKRDTQTALNEKKRDIFKTTNIVIVVITFIFLGALTFSGIREPRVEFLDNGIRIHSPFGTFVNFNRVSGIYLLPDKMASIGIGNQTTAFNLGVIKRGNFEAGLLFVHITSEPTIQIVRERGPSIFISFRDGERTEKLYHELKVFLSLFKE